MSRKADYFGNAEIFAESLQTQIDGKSIQASVDPRPDLIIQEEVMRAKMFAQERNEFNVFIKLFIKSKLRLFSPESDQASQRPSCDTVKDILQQVVYGQREKVREILDKIKSQNPVLLKEVLTSVARTPIFDYAGRKIENMTLLQAAAAAGDVSLHPELIASNINHQGMCEIIESYFDIDDQEEKKVQYTELFPNGIDVFVQAQKDNTFNLYYILDAISNATKEELHAALSLIGARFSEQDDTTRKKNFKELSLTEKLNRFREEFTQRSLNEIPNPYHLLHAFEIYDAFWDKCEENGSDPDYKKRDLFWRQIIGFIQRFMSACDAQAISQGLWYLIKVHQNSSWQPEVLKNDFTFKHDCDYSFYPLSSSCSGLGFDYMVAAPGSWYCFTVRDECIFPFCPVFLENLYEAKTSSLENLCSKRNHNSVEDHSSCSVM